jgi:hypothetical protein
MVDKPIKPDENLGMIPGSAEWAIPVSIFNRSHRNRTDKDRGV